MSILSNHYPEVLDELNGRDEDGDLANPEAEPEGQHFGIATPYQPTEEDWRDYERSTVCRPAPANLTELDRFLSRTVGNLQGLAMRLRTGLDNSREAADRLEALAAELAAALRTGLARAS